MYENFDHCAQVESSEISYIIAEAERQYFICENKENMPLKLMSQMEIKIFGQILWLQVWSCA